MIKKLCFSTLLFSAVALFSIFTVHAEMREWTQAATGNKLKGEFVRMKDEKTVTIRVAGGRSYDVPVASLSEADQTFLKEAGKPASPVGSPSKTESKSKELPKGEVTVTLSDVHLCCKACVKAVEGVKEDEKNNIDDAVDISADRGAKTITIKAPSGKEAKRTLDALVSAGFYGKSDNDALQMEDIRGKDHDFTANTMTVKDVHICCNSCVKAAKKALADVEGVEEYNIESKSSRFTVKGKDFKPYEVMSALRAAGFGGTWQ